MKLRHKLRAIAVMAYTINPVATLAIGLGLLGWLALVASVFVVIFGG